jgi:serine phosphatase RsbU (regulator of sigma subunit)
MLSGLILVFIFIKFNKLIQNFFDKNFYRGKYDYAFAQSKLSDMLEKNFSIEDLSEKLVKNISTLARLKTSAVYIFCNDEMNWSTRLFIYDNINKQFSMNLVEPDVFDTDRTFRGPVTLDYVSESTRNAIFDLNIKYIVPLKVKDKYIGLLFVGEKLSETALRNEDLDFINSLASNAAVSIDNTLMYEKLAVQERIRQELEIAHKIQVASLPQSVPEIKGLDIAGYSIPALEVGGDFYDFLNGTPGKFTVVVGDVSGKGTSAALYMSKVQGIFQTLNEFYDSPKKLLTKANHILFKHIDSKSYITAIGANFDTKNNILRIARAGHLPLFYYSKSVNEIRKVQPAGIGLGIRDEKVFDFSIEEIQIEYKKGDIFLFVTDGITESLNMILEQYGDDRLMEMLKEFNEAPAEIICAEIIKSVKHFSEKAKQHDDITLVAIKTMM